MISPKKVVFTGGHHSSGLVVAEAMKKAGWEVYWFGHRRSMEGDLSETAEYQEVIRAGIPFYELKTAKVYRVFHPLRLIRVGYGFFQASFLLKKIKPDLVFSFGGYLAPPVAISAWAQGISVFTHEQTVRVGWANKLVARFAKKIFVSWPESKKYFPEAKTIVSGLPLRQELFKPADKLVFPGRRSTIYISGGKQGSHSINEAVEAVLPKLIGRYNLIHQTGSHSGYRDYQRLVRFRSRLPDELQARYLIKEYFFKDEIGSIFAAADLVIGRAGAHFCAEVLALGKRAIFIPLPFSSRGEQQAQAKLIQKTGLATVLKQSRLTGGHLLMEIEKRLKKPVPANLIKKSESDRPVRIILAEVKKTCD